MHEIYSELRMKLSIDEETVSMNALELFTRNAETQRGLQKAMSDLVSDCA